MRYVFVNNDVIGILVFLFFSNIYVCMLLYRNREINIIWYMFFYCNCWYIVSGI